MFGSEGFNELREYAVCIGIAGLIVGIVVGGIAVGAVAAWFVTTTM